MLLRMNVSLTGNDDVDIVTTSDEIMRILASVEDAQNRILSGEFDVADNSVYADIANLDMEHLKIRLVSGDNGLFLELM